MSAVQQPPTPSGSGAAVPTPRPRPIVEPPVLGPSQPRYVHIVFASTSGHTEYVVAVLIDSLKTLAPALEIERTLAEKTQPQDLLRGDLLILASGTWNTGGVEGQLNPHMYALLQAKASDSDLAAKPCACIGLGDDRYFYRARAADRLQHYVETHNGWLIIPTLTVINEPYGQEETVRDWGKQLVDNSKQLTWS
jgi:flavodoxin I